MFILPRYRAVQVMRADVASFDTRLETAEQLKLSREDLIAEYNSIAKVDLDNVKTLLPDSVDNIRLIIQLDALATKNGMSSLRNVQYDEGKVIDPTKGDVGAAAQSPYGEFTISFDTTGQYKSFLSFIADLEQNLRLVDVVSVKFNTNESGDKLIGDSLRYTVTLKTYWLKK